MTNQTPEQKARDEIDRMLAAAGWVVQSKNKVNLAAGKGVAVQEYQTDAGPADYVLFADGKPAGIIEAKREEEGERLTTHEDQSSWYARATLKYNLNSNPLPFVYESTGVLTRFTDYRDPKPRSRPVFHFHKPETLAEWRGQAETLRAKLQNMPALDEQGEFEMPKTLVFAKTDSHADDIIQIIREEFAEDNDFCKKITYKADEDPKSVLTRFRNSWAPRIAVTVDMIATGTDVKPLEVLLFMRDVKSGNYFEQMKGRGTRTLHFDDLKKVTRTARHTKTHFVIVDAVGAVKSKKTDSRPLEHKPAVPLKDLLGAVAMGVQDEDLFISLANRLIRLGRQLTEEQMEWLRLLKDHVAASFHLTVDDLDYTPFDAKGGRGKMWQLFGDQAVDIIDELNEALAA